MKESPDVLEILLHEIPIIFSDAHTRMNVIAQLTNFSVTLSGGLIAALATLATVAKPIPIKWFLIMPLPFLIFALLIAREDLLMAKNEQYLYLIRQRIITILGRPEEDPILTFLPFIKQTKVSSWFALLSMLRYSLPVAIALLSLIWFWMNSALSVTFQGFINLVLIFVNVFMLSLLGVAINTIRTRHKYNESILPVRFRTAPNFMLNRTAPSVGNSESEAQDKGSATPRAAG